MTPDTYTRKELMLEVGDGHKLYVQDWGSNKPQKTIIYLHGGPGSGCSDTAKSLFDPDLHRVVFFDQRGCGKSVPYGSLTANTTQKLVDDIAKVADALDIDTFELTGGSWGSCLALAFGITYPERVTRMVLRGIFTGRKSEIDFMNQGDARAFYPDVWDKFVNSVPARYKKDPAAYHLPRVLGKDVIATKESAYAFLQLEGAMLSLDDRKALPDFEEFDPVPMTIECLYLAKKCFLPEGYIIKNASKLTMPVVLVQGRYDAVCPPFTAYELDQALPDSSLLWTQAGHSGKDRANWETVKALLLGR